MKNYFSSLKLNISLPIALAILVGLSGVLAMAPRASRIVKSENCDNAPDHAALNIYPVTWGNVAGTGCTDFAAISIRHTNNPQYAPSVSAMPGDEMYVSIYVHNGARQDGDPDKTTAKNIQGSVQLSGSTIFTSFYGSNTNVVNGSVSVNLPQGGTVEIIPGSQEFFDYQGNLISGNANLHTGGGSFSMGDMIACFEYSKFLRFKVKVVGPVTQGSGDIDAQTSTQNCPANLWNGIVSWRVTNVQQSAVYVDDLNDNLGPQYFSGLLEAENQPAPWLTPNHTYVFTLYNVITPETNEVELDRVTLAVPALNCEGPATGDIDAKLGNAICPAKLYNGIVSWNISNVNQSAVYVDDLDDQLGPQYFSGKLYGENESAPWLTPNHRYVFILYNVITPVSNEVELDRIQINVPAAPDCGGGATTLVCSPAFQTVTSGNPATLTASGGTAPYTWSAFSGVPSSGTGSTFKTTFTNYTLGDFNWEVTLSSADGQSKTCIVTALRKTTPQTASITLTKDVRNISTGQSAFVDTTSAKLNDTMEYRIVVSAGTSVALNNVVVKDTFASGLTYIEGTLRVNGQPHDPGLTTTGLNFPVINQGSPVTITYQARVNVSSGTIINTASATASNANNSPSDTATVNVTTAPVSVSCVANPSSILVGQSVNFTASGGTGSFTWSVNGGSVTSSSQQSFNSVFNSPGTYTATVSSGGVQNTCNVVVNTVNNPNTLSCFANQTNVSSGQTVNFTASGGTGAYNWTGNGTPSSGSGQTFSTTFYNNSPFSIYLTVTVTSGGQSASCNALVSGVANNPGQAVLSITKMVRSLNGGSYQNSVSVNQNDTVQFEIVITNTGNQTANNVRMTDTLPGGLNLVNGSVTIDGSNTSDSAFFSGMYLGSLTPGQQKRVNFQARTNTSTNSLQNIAYANSDNAGSVQASAWVFISQVAGGNVNLNYSKRAQNETKNQDATTVIAGREDYITYTLTVQNSGNTPANNFVITDDLSQVLQYADMVDNGGGSLSGNVINYPGITVPAGGSVSRSFKVRVKFSLASNLSYTMTNTYGNTVVVKINTPQVLGEFIAPKTGAETAALSFAGMFTAGAAVFRKRKYLMKLIFT